MDLWLAKLCTHGDITRFTFAFSKSSVVLEIVFWLGLALIVYAYLGYGLVLWGLVRLKRSPPPLP
ncbi:MAG TPA: hypothetical protein DCF33_03305, partial [Saprospirales bacterium]|nr:hypothetical protein [Saprospirales bacterium]